MGAFIVATVVVFVTIVITGFTFSLSKKFSSQGMIPPNPFFPFIFGMTLAFLVVISHWWPLGW